MRVCVCVYIYRRRRKAERLFAGGRKRAAVAANCNVFRDAPQVQLREFSSPGFFPRSLSLMRIFFASPPPLRAASCVAVFRRFLRLFRDGGTQLLTGNFEGFYGAINLLRHA